MDECAASPHLGDSAMRLLILLPFLSGCVTFGSTGWIAKHSLEIGQVGLVAGAVSQVESATINGIELVDKAKK